MKKELTLRQKKIRIILSSIIFILATIVIIHNIQDEKEYINGNILNLPLLNEEMIEDSELLSPLIEQEIGGLFLYRSLFMPDNTLQNITPDLAESYTLSEDGKTYNIVLKENNRWSDGELIKPQDVVFTLETIMKSEDYNYMFATVSKYVEGADEYIEGKADTVSGLSINDNTITIELHTKYNTFLPVMSQVVILPSHILEGEDIKEIQTGDFWKNPVVSGMYKFDEMVKNDTEQYFKLVKNEYYTEEKSDIEEVRLHTASSKKTLDYNATNNTRTMTTYNNATHYTGYDVQMLLYRFFVFNIIGNDGNYNEVMDNELLRKAIVTAIDREGILSYVYMNVGEVVNSGIIKENPDNNGFVHEYNPEEAIRLLKEAEYDFDRVFTIAYSSEETQNVSLLSKVVSDLEAIGLKVELIYVSTDEEKYVDRNFDMILYDIMAFNENAWYSEYDNGNKFHDNFFSLDNDFEGLFRGLRESTTPEIRTEYLKHLQNLEQERLYILPMFSLNQVIYIQEQRVNIPEDIEFGNPRFRYDISLKDWSIKKE